MGPFSLPVPNLHRFRSICINNHMKKFFTISASTDAQGYRVWKSFRAFAAGRGLKIGYALVQAITAYMEKMK